jgi:hypothetical protein
MNYVANIQLYFYIMFTSFKHVDFKLYFVFISVFILMTPCDVILYNFMLQYESII